MTTLATHTEKQLLHLAAAGDQSAFNEIFHRYKLKLYSYMERLTGSSEQAEDIVQEVFIKVWENRATLPEIENLNAWMFRVAHNKAISSFRTWVKERKMLQELIYNGSAGEPADHTLTLKEAEQLLANAINLLPPQQKMIYQLSREQGLRHDEIARQMQLAPGTVNNHIIRALRTLRDYVQKHRGNAALLTLFMSVVDAFDNDFIKN